MTAAIIAERLGAVSRSGQWWRCRCPVHNSTRATLALRDGLSGLILHCHAGCARAEVLARLQQLGLFGQDAAAAPIDPAVAECHRKLEKHELQRRIAKALYLWRHETAPPDGTAIERYWTVRGLAGLPIPPTVRAARSWLRHPEGGTRPAMIALVEHADYGPVAIHRTWLQTDGTAKASFRDPRLSLGPVGGGAVRLAPANERQPLIVGEGIETTASVMVAAGLPGWAALSANGIAQLILHQMPATPTVIIAADHDSSGVGERAARAAAERWLAEGRRVRIALPPVPGTDWNDVLLNTDRMEARDAA